MADHCIDSSLVRIVRNHYLQTLYLTDIIAEVKGGEVPVIFNEGLVDYNSEVNILFILIVVEVIVILLVVGNKEGFFMFILVCLVV